MWWYVIHVHSEALSPSPGSIVVLCVYVMPAVSKRLYILILTAPVWSTIPLSHASSGGTTALALQFRGTLDSHLRYVDYVDH